MDIIAAYREVGAYRGAGSMTGTTHKTVKRAIARREVGGAAPGRAPRGHNYDGVAALVAEWVDKTPGRISTNRLLPAARATGYAGSDRNFRRLVAERKRGCGGLSITAGAARRCGRCWSSWHPPVRSLPSTLL
jgi:hypothetical protein